MTLRFPLLTATVVIVLLGLAASRAGGEQVIASVHHSHPTVVYREPMRPLTVLDGVSVIGTDEGICTSKDPSGDNVQPNPTAGFFQIPFVMPENNFVRLNGVFFAPDSLANSMYLQFNEGSGWEWGMSQTKRAVKDIAVKTAHAGSDFSNHCYYMTQGAHTVRFFVREPGAAFVSVNVTMVDQVSIAGIRGCSPDCPWNSRLTLFVTLNNFCGPSQLHAGLIRVNGQNCSTLEQTADGEVMCLLDSVAPTTEPVTVSLHAKDAAWDTLHSASTVEIPFEPVPTTSSSFPVWAIIVIVVVVLLVCAPIVYFYKKHARTAHAPKDAAAPIAVAVVSIKHAGAFVQCRPVTHQACLKRYHGIVRDAVSRNKCYLVRKMGDAFVVVAKDPRNALHFATDVQERMRAINWEASIDPSELRQTTRASRVTGMRKSVASTIKPPSSAASTVSSATNREQHLSLAAAVGIQFGVCGLEHDADRDTYEYTGTCVDDAAVIADFAVSNEVLVSEALWDEAADVEGVSTDLEEKELPSGKHQLVRFASRSMVGLVYESRADSDDGGSALAALQEAQQGFSRKKITVLHARVHGVTEALASLSRDKFAKWYPEVVELVHETAAGNRGVVHSSSAGVFVITFNAASAAGAHAMKAANCAAELSAIFAETPNVTRVSSGLASGQAECGHTKEGSAVVSVALEKAEFLEARCRTYPDTIQCVVAEEARGDISSAVFFASVDIATNLPGAKAADPVILLGITGARAEEEADEWMYQLENADTKDTAKLVNDAFIAFKAGKVDEARALIEKDTDAGTEFSRQQLLRLMRA